MPQRSGYNSVVAAVSELKSLFRTQVVDEHKKTWNPDDIPRDFVDVYLAKIMTTVDTLSSFYGKVGGNLPLCLTCQGH